jgi:hypothetical protein
MKRKLKVKFSLIVPCEKEIVIHDEKEFNDNKESFLLACSDENDCQLLLSDYIEEYGIESISDSFEKIVLIEKYIAYNLLLTIKVILFIKKRNEHILFRY